MKEDSCPLSVLPNNTKSKVISNYPWGNFDIKKENKRGSLHTTHGVAFQEEVEGKTKRRDEAVIVVPSAKRAVHVLPQKHFSPNI